MKDYPEEIQKIVDRIPEGYFRFLSIHPGWYPIVAKLNEDIAALYPDYQVLQVKEKFGGLRYYYEIYKQGDDFFEPVLDDKVDELVREAEEKSLKICELCGEPGELKTDVWWHKTLCDNCNEKRVEQTK